MHTFSSPEKIEDTANRLWIYIHPAFEWETRSLLSTKKGIPNNEAKSQTQLQDLQKVEDPDWQELMDQTSHHVIEVLLAVMNNKELGNGLIFVPGIDTTRWHTTNNNWLLRSSPTERSTWHTPLISNLPLHTDSVTSQFHDDSNDLVKWTLLYGIKYNPTSYFHLWEAMPKWLNNAKQAWEIADLFWYDADELRRKETSIQGEIDTIMMRTNFPQIDFHRTSPYSGFTIQSWITFQDSSTWHDIQNPIAHTWYLPKLWDPTWYLRLIKARDLDMIFNS